MKAPNLKLHATHVSVNDFADQGPRNAAGVLTEAFCGPGPNVAVCGPGYSFWAQTTALQQRANLYDLCSEAAAEEPGAL